MGNDDIHLIQYALKGSEITENMGLWGILPSNNPTNSNNIIVV